MALTFGELSNPFLGDDRRPQPAGPAVLSPEEASTLGGLMEGGLGGLAYLGKVLDKTFGGRALRGLLGGRPNELLSVLPFSDTLGITDERDVVRGERLLSDLGVLDTGDTSFGATLAGVGAEIALDPSLYFGAGVPRAVAKLGGVLGRGTGAAVEAATGLNPYRGAGNLLGAARDRVVPPIRALFDTGVAGTHIGAVQDNVALPVFTPQLRAGRDAEEMFAAEANSLLEPLAKRTPQSQQVLNDAMTEIGEGFTQAGRSRLAAAGYTPDEIDQVAGLAGRLQGRTREFLAAERGEGLLSKDLVDLPDWKLRENQAAIDAGLPPRWEAQAGYLPRTLAPYPGSDMPFGRVTKGQAGGGSEFQLGREEFLLGVPGGTTKLNEFARDANLSGATRAFTPDQAANFFAEHVTGLPVTQIPLNSPALTQGRHLADFFENLRPEAMQNGLFNTDIVGNVLARGRESARQVASAKAAMRTVDPAAGFVKPVALFEQSGQPYVRVTEFLDSQMLKGTDATTGTPIAREVTARLLGIDTANPLWQRDLAHFAIPKDVAIDVGRMGQAWVTPETMRPILGVWDSFVNLFKTALTAPFPAFHVRNGVSGFFNMWRDGIAPPAMVANSAEMLSVMRGGRLSDDVAARLYPGLDAEAATKAFRTELIGNRIAFVRGGQTSEVVGGQLGSAAGPGGMLAKDVPAVGAAAMRPITEDLGTFGNTLWGQGGDGTSWRKVPEMVGVFGGTRDTNPLVAAGRMAGNTVEDTVRGTHYLSKRLMGQTPADAKLATMKYQIDYADMTNFEREVMKRLFPWYAFSRKNLPPLLEDLAKQPGRITPFVRLATGSRTEGEFVPPWVAEGSSVRLPGAPDGFSRYISSFGLPFEDEAIKTLGAAVQGDSRRTFQQLFGMSQPFVKLPAEIATGTQMFSGRRLEDLRPYEFADLGGLLPEDRARQLSQLIANSPASRFASSADKFLDDRKGAIPSLVNMLTGVRVTDVDEAVVRERAAADLLRNRLRGQPGVRSRDDVYVPRELVPTLDPADLQLYNLLREVEARQASRARASR